MSDCNHVHEIFAVSARVPTVEVDINCVLEAWSVMCPIRQEAIPCLLLAESGWGGTVTTYLERAEQALERAKTLEAQRAIMDV